MGEGEARGTTSYRSRRKTCLEQEEEGDGITFDKPDCSLGERGKGGRRGGGERAEGGMELKNEGELEVEGILGKFEGVISNLVMRKFCVSAVCAFVAFGSLNVSAQDAAVSISPEPGEYDTLPTSFVVSFDGPSSIARNIAAGGNPLLITSPKGEKLQVAGTFSGTVMTCQIPASSTLPLDENGDYSVQLRANSINYTWADGTKTQSKMSEFVYNVRGKEEEELEGPKEVVYDIEFQKTIPNLNPFDLKGFELDILQIYFNMPNLQIGSSADAKVTITGPEYSRTASLQPNMNMPSSTVFRATFTNPIYSGTYTLTIPQGVVGDEEWIKDHRYGHANAEVVYEFQVIHGLSSEDATVTISPLPGTFDMLPNEFVLTIDGPVSIEKNITGGNPLLITSPKGTTQQVSGTISGKTVTCKVPGTFALDEPGDYKVTFREGSITYIWEDDSKSTSKGAEYVYNVIGNEEEGPEEPKEVAYDITMNKTIPNLRPLDLEMYGIETLQIYFDRGGLQIASGADAFVTISGPNYYGSAVLVPNMNMPAATVFKAIFNDPKYDGTYTLTIPRGIIGDETWIKDRSMGHANAEVVYEFTVTGGEDPSTITRDLTFNPRVTPSSGSKVADLSKISLQFNSEPYWDPEAEIQVNYRADLSESGSDSKFGKASIAKGEGNSLVLSIVPTPRSNGQYSLILPEGVIWNEDHENDEDGGALNCEMVFSWYLSGETVGLEITGHVPATDAHIGCFPVDKECIVIMTNKKDEVGSADFELIEYKLNDESAAPVTLFNETSSDINSDGYICWINRTGNDIELSADCYYEVVYTLKDASGNRLDDGSFEFYGDMSTGISGVISDSGARIYNLSGVEVKGGALPAGLYIKVTPAGVEKIRIR